MYRNSYYNQMLSKKLNGSKTFAQGYLLTLMEGDDGLSPLDALKHTIQSMGILEFSKWAGIPEKSVSRMLRTPDAPKVETLDRYLAPFGLKVKIGVETAA